MKKSLSLGVLAFLALAGCAHTPKPATNSFTSTEPAPPVPPVQQKAEAPVKVAAAPDYSAQLDAALRSTTLLFDFNSAQLKPASLEALQRVAQILKKDRSVVIQIEGNCDERGTEEYNLVLGHRRAEAARKYLADLGVSDKQLEAVSYGALHPANPDHTEAAWAQNRRDDLRAAR